MNKGKSKKQVNQKSFYSGMINYPIGDFLIRIKNAALAGNREVEVKKTKLILSVAKLLKKEGFLDEVKEEKDKLVVNLRFRNKQPVMYSLKLVSSPGLRIYMSADELDKKRGPSTFIVSTSRGILVSREAIKNRVGGEVIAEIL